MRPVRRVSCLPSKHLQENYEFWSREMEKECHSSSGTSEDSSTPVLNAPIEELTESEE